MLLQHDNIDVNRADNSGETALMHASLMHAYPLYRFSDRAKTALMLIKCPGIKLNAQDKQGIK